MNCEDNRRMIHELLATAACFAVLAVCCSRTAAAQEGAEAPRTPASDSSLLGPPNVDGAVEVRTSFQLLNLSEIDDEAEKVTLSGVLTLVWKDTRQSFDPSEEGVSEKVFSGAYQFNELSPSWYPQVTLANAAGQYDSRAVVLVVKPDGTSTLSEEIEAVVKVDLAMRRFPFDRQRLELVFQAFGFDTSKVVLAAKPDSASIESSLAKLPQWTLEGIEASVRTMNAPTPGGTGDVSAVVVSLDVKRQPLFMLRLVVIPLALIVMLSWSVFWMDRSSVGDRMAVSFVGILTAVAYQITLVGIVPSVSYFTLMYAFLNVSFLLMSATVVINLYVAVADRRGHERGDRIDRCCRWLFPLAYLGLTTISVAAVLLFY